MTGNYGGTVAVKGHPFRTSISDFHFIALPTSDFHFRLNIRQRAQHYYGTALLVAGAILSILGEWKRPHWLLLDVIIRFNTDSKGSATHSTQCYTYIHRGLCLARSWENMEQCSTTWKIVGGGSFIIGGERDIKASSPAKICDLFYV